MHGAAQVAAPEVVAQLPGHEPAECLLAGLVEVPSQDAVIERRALRDLPDEFDEARSQFVEDPLHLGRLHPGLVLVEEGVVPPVLVAQVLGDLPRQIEQVLQRRREGGIVVLLARLHPDLVAERRRPRQLAHERRWQLHRLVEGAAGDADKGGLVGVGVRAGGLDFRAFEQAAGLVGDEHLVRDPPEHGELLGALRGAPRRHVALLVPAQHGDRRVDALDLGEPRLQVGKVLQAFPHPCPRVLRRPLKPPPRDRVFRGRRGSGGPGKLYHTGVAPLFYSCRGSAAATPERQAATRRSS
jgi:hypothetical protein